ncbi:hypothetical protein DUNSADRAFT_6342 [Dunaliella salina]|uniref:Uncharacterized protein n=1 Tax=Dunaliella salina TaxID=3046 RepID=A0ABQ7GNE7_DUNSA|nr:hypothetical protein DUNSADRAFT_6342 [Dunaliella salina]|eukprot:KAF5836139.1 hypothetical protein DUNSADRAFT_6342 [Dunaliella salina]
MDAASMESACNKLHAAGDDLEALQEAVEAASYLDSVPGDFRQKLRAARSRLRKLQEQRERGVAAADRSPHAKAEYNTAEFDELVKKFEQLSWRMVSRPGGAVAKPDDFYRLYGLKQQVLHGDCNEERPMWAERGGLDFEGELIHAVA